MIEDLILNVTQRLETVEINSFYKSTSLTDNYIVFEMEVFDKSYQRVDGQIVVDLRYENVMDLLAMQERVINALDKWKYISEKTSCNVFGYIINDLSSIATNNFYHEIRFEFQLRKIKE